MQNEIARATDVSEVSVIGNVGISELSGLTGVYTVECFGADGELKWADSFKNLVTTVGKNAVLDTYFAGSAYTAAWYMSLVNGGTTPTYAATDTMASHTGWTEITGYSAATRPAITWSGAAASGSKVTNAISFSINATATIAGAFVVTDSTKSGTAGTLYSAGSFSGGNRSVISGDTLSVTYTATVA